MLLVSQNSICIIAPFAAEDTLTVRIDNYSAFAIYLKVTYMHCVYTRSIE